MGVSSEKETVQKPTKDEKMLPPLRVNLLKRLMAGINKASEVSGRYGGTVTLLAIIGIMVYEVIARYVFNRPTRFALEFSIFSQILLVSATAAYILKEEGHVSIELITERLSERKRNWFLCWTSIIGALYSVFLTIQVWKTATWSFHVGTASETVGIPLAPLQFILTGGLALLVLQFIARIYKYALLARGGKHSNLEYF